LLRERFRGRRRESPARGLLDQAIDQGGAHALAAVVVVDADVDRAACVPAAGPGGPAASRRAARRARSASRALRPRR
jgi:hypothetical protein